MPESEFELIRRLAEIVGRRGPGVDVGVGDDAAVLPATSVATVDLLVEDVHFRRHDHVARGPGLEGAGRQRLRPRGDGRRPLGALVGLVAPPTLTGDAVAELYRGLEACAQAYGCPVVGGDVSRGPALTLAVTALGRTDGPALRNGARPGDVLAVTGPLGGSGAGWRVLEGRVDLPPALAQRRRRAPPPPAPRLAEGQALAGRSCTRCSTSPTASPPTRCGWPRPAARRRSSTSTRCRWTAGSPRRPPALGLAPGVLAATGGEDYELLVALPPDRRGRPRACRCTSSAASRQGPAAVRFEGAGARDDLAGWDHLGA